MKFLPLLLLLALSLLAVGYTMIPAAEEFSDIAIGEWEQQVFHRDSPKLKLQWEPSKPKGSAYGYALYCEGETQTGQGSCAYIGEDNKFTCLLFFNWPIKFRVRPIAKGEECVVAGMGEVSEWSAWYIWDEIRLTITESQGGVMLMWDKNLGTVEIQHSEDLVTWRYLATSNTGSYWESVKGVEQRFYRVKK